MGFEKRAELTVSIPTPKGGGGITTTGFMWKWGEYNDSDSTSELEKSKRNRLSMALRDLSDSELASLRQRLATGDIDQSQLERLLDDESELSKVKRR